MGNPDLKYRTRFTSSMKLELWDAFNKLSKDTRIDKRKLLDEAVEDLLLKHGHDVPEEPPKTRKL